MGGVSAPTPVPRYDVWGPGRLPVDLRWERRSAACTPGTPCVQRPVPDRTLPKTPQARARFQKAVAPLVGAAPALQTLQQPWRTKIVLGSEFLAASLAHTVPGHVLFCARGSRADALVSRARYRHKAGSSVRKHNRHLATNSCVCKEAAGPPRRLDGPPRAVQDLVPRVPPTASRAGTVGDPIDGTLTLAVRLPGRGTVRLGVRFATAARPGTSAVLVTPRVDWRAQRMSARSLHRWPLAPLSPDGTTPLGVDASRLRTADARGKPWCLVVVASAFWPRDGLPPSPRQGSVPRTTLGAAGRQHGPTLLESLILSAHAQRQRGQQAGEIFAAVCAKHHPVLAR